MFFHELQRLLPLPPRNGSTAPWWLGIHIIAATAFLVRLTLALLSDHINHPDEIFQYLEQAHRLVFGYGYVPWEYRFGTRSWILPGIVAAPLLLCKSLGIRDAALYIAAVKAFFCAFSISLVYSTYIVGRRLGREMAGRVGAFFVCVWYELVYFAHKPTPEVLAMYCLVGALACALSNPNERRRTLHGLLGGLLLGTCLVLRIQYAVPVAFLAALMFWRWPWTESLAAAAAVLGVVSLAGAVDYFTWGRFFLSYYNSYLFNIGYHISDRFGIRPVYYYLAALTIASAGLVTAAGVSGLLRVRQSWPVLVCAAAVVVSHSAIPHKEYRFTIATVPLLLLVGALAITGDDANRAAWRRRAIFLALPTVTLVSALGLFQLLPKESKVYAKPLYSREPILTAYRFLGAERDLGPVLDLFSDPAHTGGYYYLHRDVPIYSMQQLEQSGVALSDLGSFVTHVVCTTDQAVIPGFETVIRLEGLEVRMQKHPPASLRRLDVDTRNVLFPRIDGIYQPNVERLL